MGERTAVSSKCLPRTRPRQLTWERQWVAVPDSLPPLIGAGGEEGWEAVGPCEEVEGLAERLLVQVLVPQRLSYDSWISHLQNLRARGTLRV